MFCMPKKNMAKVFIHSTSHSFETQQLVMRILSVGLAKAKQTSEHQIDCEFGCYHLQVTVEQDDKIQSVYQNGISGWSSLPSCVFKP